MLFIIWVRGLVACEYFKILFFPIFAFQIPSAMSKRIILVFLLFFAGSQLVAQHLTPYRNTVPDAYNFWIYTPGDYAPDTVRYPLVLFLHGSSLCGSDLDRVRRYGPLNAIEMGLQLDALVLAPQNGGGAWKPDKVARLLDWTIAHYPVDTNRVYVLGMSLGGFGTLDFVATYPHRVAAAMALCGGASVKDLCGLNELPLWILHGTADRAVSVNASQRVVDAMNRCGAADRLIFTRLQGLNHGSLVYAFYRPDVYSWLFAHRLDDPNRPVDRSLQLTPAHFNRGVYRDIRQSVHITVANSQNEEEAAPSVASPKSVESETAVESGQSGASPQYYTIRKGDTLGTIAKRHHTTVKALCQLNGITPTTTLRIGRRLRVK